MLDAAWGMSQAWFTLVGGEGRRTVLVQVDKLEGVGISCHLFGGDGEFGDMTEGNGG
jgi:hypothetical protein